MKQRIAVIGAGHAGVEAARVAGEAGMEVTLFSAETGHPYFRPRLVTVAFREAEAGSILMHPPNWYTERHITVRIGARVEGFDATALSVRAGGADERFDGVVLANGSVPVMPPFGAGLADRVMPLWNMEQALAVQGRIRRDGHMVVVGGGILGLETALRAAMFGMRVTLVELAERLMPIHFGRRMAEVLLTQVRRRNIDVSLCRRIVAAQAVSPGERVRLTLDNGGATECDLCVVTVGARPDLSLGTMAGLECERGIKVDAMLRTSAPNVLAAGDVAQVAGVTRCSVREATAKGKTAGSNLVSLLTGGALSPYVPPLLPLSFKARDFELYAFGEPVSDEHREVWLDGSSDSIARSILVRDDVAVGVQMVGTREGFDEWAGKLGQKVDGDTLSMKQA